MFQKLTEKSLSKLETNNNIRPPHILTKKIYPIDEMTDTIIEGHSVDVMRTLPYKSVHCIITSPPYWGLRDYGIEGIIWDGDPDAIMSLVTI